MPTTANYSWPTPADTDLVKDGALAIRNLGNAVDTTTKAVADGRGLVHIKTVNSGGAVASFSVDNAFSADFRNYKVFMSLNGNNDQNGTIRMRVAGADNSTSNSYVSQFIAASGTGVSGARTTSTNAQIFIYNNTLKNASDITFYSPFLTVATVARSINVGSSSSAFIKDYVVTHNQTISYDGFTLFAAAGETITIDNLSVYGLKEA